MEGRRRAGSREEWRMVPLGVPLGVAEYRTLREVESTCRKKWLKSVFNHPIVYVVEVKRE